MFQLYGFFPLPVAISVPSPTGIVEDDGQEVSLLTTMDFVTIPVVKQGMKSVALQFDDLTMVEADQFDFLISKAVPDEVVFVKDSLLGIHSICKIAPDNASIKKDLENNTATANITLLVYEGYKV